MRSPDDRTAVARIRDAAIEQFGHRGFGVGLRTIADAAGVSPALLIHHFGSKQGLRQACDDHVLAVIRDRKTETMRSADPASWLAEMAEIESHEPLLAYVVSSMKDGGALSNTLINGMSEASEQYLEEGVRQGTLKPTRDPRARARFLTLYSTGGFLLYLQTRADPSDLRAALRDYARDIALPAMELYTHGLLADSAMYDAFVAEYAEPTDGPAGPRKKGAGRDVTA